MDQPIDQPTRRLIESRARDKKMSFSNYLSLLQQNDFKVEFFHSLSIFSMVFLKKRLDLIPFFKITDMQYKICDSILNEKQTRPIVGIRRVLKAISDRQTDQPMDRPMD